ncbi:MAG: hypothetical protein NXI27_07845 [Alphaproteobacteria bacterium]|nr:hypothetical protein [Alphaproteobacteria bacterium]
MLRLFLVFGFVLVGALQGVERGTAGDATTIDATVEQMLHDVARIDDQKCCDDSKVAEEKPSICKPDCKAVIAMGVLRPRPSLTDYGPQLQTDIASIGGVVDLRPPIS